MQIRIMTHKNRDNSDVNEAFRKLGFDVKEYIDTSDDYKLENNMRNRHRGAQENLVKMVTDFELPEDNNGFIIMAEDDVIPCDNLYKALKKFVAEAPKDRCYSGFHMRFIAHPKEFGQAEKISPYSFLNTQFWIMPLDLAREFDEYRWWHNDCEDGLMYWTSPNMLRRQVCPTDVFINRFIRDRGQRPLCIYPNFVEHKHVESLCDNKWLHKNGVPRSSVWFVPSYDYSRVKWAMASKRYDTPNSEAWVSIW